MTFHGSNVWSWMRDSNSRPHDYESGALPAELIQHMPPGFRQAPLIVTQRIYVVNHKSGKRFSVLLQSVIAFSTRFAPFFHALCQVVILHKVFLKLSKNSVWVFGCIFIILALISCFSYANGKINDTQPRNSKTLSTFPTELQTSDKRPVFNRFLNYCNFL